MNHLCILCLKLFLFHYNQFLFLFQYELSYYHPQNIEEKPPKYEYHLGDTVYIGADEYEIAGISDNTVTLYDPNHLNHEQ